MKKKVVSVLMAAAMVAGMAGCGSSNTGNAGTTNSNASTNNEATTESGDASADAAATDSDVEKPEEITIMGRWNCFHTGKRTGRVHCQIRGSSWNEDQCDPAGS